MINISNFIIRLYKHFLIQWLVKSPGLTDLDKNRHIILRSTQIEWLGKPPKKLSKFQQRWFLPRCVGSRRYWISINCELSTGIFLKIQSEIWYAISKTQGRPYSPCQKMSSCYQDVCSPPHIHLCIIFHSPGVYIRHAVRRLNSSLLMCTKDFPQQCR